MKRFKLVLSIVLTFLLIFGIAVPVQFVKANPAGWTDEECPSAIEGLTYSGEKLQLVSPPAKMHEGYTSIAYALGSDDTTAPGTDGDWQMDPPEKAEAGTYYVWWCANTDTDSTDPCVITVTISENSDPSETGDEDEDVDEAAEKVIKLIDEIGVVEYTDECDERIEAARLAYNSLSYDQQQKVSNISVLDDAIEEYRRLAEESGGSEGGDDYDGDEWEYPIMDEIALKQELGDVLNEVQVVHIQGSFALTYDILDQLQYDDMVRLEYALTFDGKEYNLVIPGGYELVEENIMYYGPAYLISHFGSGAVLKKFDNSAGDTYIVQEGDTLNKIAEMFGTTVDELVRLNGLSNPNMIYVGQEIVYENGYESEEE